MIKSATLIIDNFLNNPDEYVNSILSGQFVDVPDGEKMFKGIQPREKDEFMIKVLELFPEYIVNYNFVRQSPKGQEEPNFIHKDDMMGDITVLLYLNKEHPEEEGTIFYDDNLKLSSRVYMKYNRAVAFEAGINHSRAVEENFGEGNDSRLIQVIFLKKK